VCHKAHTIPSHAPTHRQALSSSVESCVRGHHYNGSHIGLARTVYVRRIWPYIWWLPSQKYRMYTVYTWFWPTQWWFPCQKPCIYNVYTWSWPTQNIPFCHFTCINGSGQPKTYRSVTLQRIYMVLANPKHTVLSLYNVYTWFWPTQNIPFCHITT